MLSEYDVSTSPNFSDLRARERAEALLDSGTLSIVEDDPPGILLARGRIGDRMLLIAFTDGHHRGGTIGVAEADALSRISHCVRAERPHGVVLCWDTGGVRVQEGPAALAAASAVGVALSRMALSGIPVLSVISGRRGCFGAASVIAAAAHRVVLTRDALWGLTGPRLLWQGRHHADREEGRSAVSAPERLRLGHADRVCDDSIAGVRSEIDTFLQDPLRHVDARSVLERFLAGNEPALRRIWNDPEHAWFEEKRSRGTPRDFFRYSLRGQWLVDGPRLRIGEIQVAWGHLAGRRAMGIIVGTGSGRGGIGIEDADLVVRAVRFTMSESGSAPAPIVIFLFCRGHSSDLSEERAGLPVALARCLRSLVVARLAGHPLICVLGGGAYGAAYLTLAAPSHRVVAVRGTRIAPMAPRLLEAFDRMRGKERSRSATAVDVAESIPEIRIAPSVVRLRTVLPEELEQATTMAQHEGTRTRFTLADLR